MVCHLIQPRGLIEAAVTRNPSGLLHSVLMHWQARTQTLQVAAHVLAKADCIEMKLLALCMLGLSGDSRKK